MASVAKATAHRQDASEAFKPMSRQSLSDRIAGEIRRLIQSAGYEEGDRLPPIMEMARRFGVGHPTVREALKKLETTGIVDIRHGSGVYVTRSHDVLVLASPDYSAAPTKKLLVDLIETRMQLEAHSVELAARNATEEHLREMRRLLKVAGEHLEDDDVLNSVNMDFHHEIAVASGNVVLHQLLDVLHELFSAEQRMILGIFGSSSRDHDQHEAILEALERRDAQRAGALMKAHLEGVRDTILGWDPKHHPLT